MTASEKIIMTNSKLDDKENGDHSITLKDKRDFEELRRSIQATLHETDYWNLWEKEHGYDNLAELAQQTTKELLNDDFHLLRVLIARKYDMKLSTDLFIEQVKWRTKWQPKDIDPSTIPCALKSGAWRLCGYSKEGCVVSNYKLSLWKPNEYGDVSKPEVRSSFFSSFSSSSPEEPSQSESNEAVHEYVRYIAYMLELIIAKMPPLPVPQQFVILFDLDGFSSDLVLSKRARHMIGSLIYVAQSQYPERLRKVYLINAPWGFSTAWKLISAMLDAKTASKVSFVSGNLVESMNEHIDEDALSIAYGGKHAEYDTPSLSLSEEMKRVIT